VPHRVWLREFVRWYTTYDRQSAIGYMTSD